MTETIEQPGEAPRTRRALDVSHLPTSAWDHHEPAWWGNLLAILIETTTLIIAIASYLYLHQNFGQWPPPRIDTQPILGNPTPDLLLGTINVALMLATCLTMYWTDMAARRKDRTAVLGWLLLMLVVSLICTAIRFYEFPHLHVRWDFNAYGSLVWLILGLHLTYLIALASEFLVMWVWLATHEFDNHHALDVTLAGGGWYWVAGTGLIVYLVVYWGARIL
jgi:heme/copper-type cytochrome/quinol oxidase subunit 3